MGKEKQKQYQYSSEYKYLRSYDTLKEVFEKYFDGKVGKLYEYNRPYKELPDGTFISYFRIGRAGLKEAIRRHEDPTCYKRIDDKKIEIYNFFGEKVGEVDNVRVLKAIMSSSFDQANSGLYKSSKKAWWGNLTYKFNG